MTLRGHQGAFKCATFSPDGKYIISGSCDKTIKLWDAASGAEVRTFQGHKDIVRSVAVSPDGKQIVSGSDDKTIKLWNMANGSEVMTFQGHRDMVRSVAFSPDGKRIVSAAGREIRIWDASTGTALMIMHGHGNSVYCVSYSPDGRRIISGSIDGTAKLWDSVTGDELVTLRAHSGVSSVVFRPDGMAIAGGTFDGNVVLWESALPASSYEPRKDAESARRLVEKLYRKYGSYHEVLSRVQGDAMLGSRVREMSLRIADTCKWKDADNLVSEAWATVGLPEKDIKAYQGALEKVDRANALEPNDPAILSTQGAAQYRLGSFEEALKTLAKSAQMLSDAKEEPDPVNAAFTAMTLHQIGRTSEAKAALGQLRELCKEEQFAEETEVQTLLAEAEGLIEGKKL